jgi:outer membrane protein OmpA-like peptidoglycan-associated protein
MKHRAASGLSISLPTLRPKLPRWLPILAIAIALAGALLLLAVTRERSSNASDLGTATTVTGRPESASRGFALPDDAADAIPAVSDPGGRSLPTTVTGLLNLPAVERIKPTTTVRPIASVPVATGPLSSGTPPDTSQADCPTWNLIGPWFDPDEAIPHPDAWALLADIAAELRLTNFPVRIVGHTDIRTPAFPGGNQGLSEARAQSVLEQLVTMRISNNRMTATGRGADDLVNTGTSEYAHQQNRRVVVIVLCKS